VRLRGYITDAFDWLRHTLPAKLGRRGMIGAGGGLAALVILLLVLGPLSGDENEGEAETRVVTVAVTSDEPTEAPVGTLGFPLVATRNTTRVGGPDPVADAAAVALATHPPAPDAEPVEAAVVVGDWQSGVAASVLAGPPLRAPILVGTEGEVPQPTADAIAKLKPRGGSGPDDVAVYTVGDAEAPSDLQSEAVKGDSPAERAAAIDLIRAELFKSEPGHILVASSDDPEYAMPAAGWAARSGDPVLFVGEDGIPEATVDALRRNDGTPVYVLGPESAISKQTMKEIERIAPSAQRVGDEGPVENAIAFARFVDGSFGWNINDPGHGFVIANTDRSLDAAIAAPLSASGTWGPLLVTDDAGRLPAPLAEYLLDLKPGYEDDPTRALYNHVWLIGDTSAVSVDLQAEADELAEVTRITSGSGESVDPAQGAPESQPDEPNDDR